MFNEDIISVRVTPHQYSFLIPLLPLIWVSLPSSRLQRPSFITLQQTLFHSHCVLTFSPSSPTTYYSSHQPSVQPVWALPLLHFFFLFIASLHLPLLLSWVSAAPHPANPAFVLHILPIYQFSSLKSKHSSPTLPSSSPRRLWRKENTNYGVIQFC